MSEHRTVIKYATVDLDEDDDVEITDSEGEQLWLPRRLLVAWLATLPPLDPPLDAKEVEAMR